MKIMIFEMKLIYIFFLIIFGLIAAEDNDDKVNVEKGFTDSQIVPDVVSVAPTELLDVEYKTPDKEVKLGNELTPKEVRDAPKVEYRGDPNAFYTLIMTDPDAPSRADHKFREYHHWLVVNIPGSDVSKGEILSEYIGSGPPQGSGLHRYVFLLYKQPGELKFSEPHKSNRDGNRGRFSAEKFAKAHGLGNPIAGNFFVAQYDDSVPSLVKQLGF